LFARRGLCTLIRSSSTVDPPTRKSNHMLVARAHFRRFCDRNDQDG
jgi:hypothetical protein